MCGLKRIFPKKSKDKHQDERQEHLSCDDKKLSSKSQPFEKAQEVFHVPERIDDQEQSKSECQQCHRPING